MKQHKWHKEIKAWADGAEIEQKHITINMWSEFDGDWYSDGNWEYRIKPQPKNTRLLNDYIAEVEKNPKIKEALDDVRKKYKPQPKEPQYLYVYLDDRYEFAPIKIDNPLWQYIGKIKLEVEDGN